MNLVHILKSFFVTERELKDNVVNLLAVAIFADSIVRPKEVRQSYILLENLFDGEDYNYLIEEIDILLDSFQEFPEKYIFAREKAILFVKNNKSMRRELIEIMKLVFRSDHEVHKREEELIGIFDRNNNNKGDAE